MKQRSSVGHAAFSTPNLGECRLQIGSEGVNEHARVADL